MAYSSHIHRSSVPDTALLHYYIGDNVTNLKVNADLKICQYLRIHLCGREICKKFVYKTFKNNSIISLLF